VTIDHDVEFFWDPMCPWAWLTSRWVAEVARQRDLHVDWRFISLRMVNEGRTLDPAYAERVAVGHGVGLKLLRVAAAMRADGRREELGHWYTVFGGDIHVQRRRKELTDHYEAGFPEYLRAAGVPEQYLAAANDERWDADVRADTETALRRAGDDVGTPIISFNPGGGELQSFFGPVISRVPRGEDATRLWDALWEVVTYPGFAEVKRSIRETPQLEDSLG
jgi:2-hydroxychromene-2-carboxylate isomerase